MRARENQQSLSGNLVVLYIEDFVVTKFYAADTVICISQTSVRKHWRGVEESKISVAPNAVDAEVLRMNLIYSMK